MAGGLRIEVAEGGVGRLVLDRPELHNAFDDALIASLTEALLRLEADPGVRVVVLAGEGRSFSAGADLNWMKRMAGYGRAENLADATALAAMLKTLHRRSTALFAQQSQAFTIDALKNVADLQTVCIRVSASLGDPASTAIAFPGLEPAVLICGVSSKMRI